MEATDQTGDDEQQALSGGSQIANPTSCESHHLRKYKLDYFFQFLI